MPAQYGKGARAKATKLHSKIIRETAGQCERCGSKDHNQCAHIVSRNFSWTRTDLRNAFCLCAKCHWYLDHWPLEMYKFTVAQHGSLDLYEELKAQAEAGRGKKFDWPAELERLQEIDRGRK